MNQSEPESPLPNVRVSQISGHQWSGWPGAYCLKCGGGQALDTMMALGWFECYPEEVGDGNYPPDGVDIFDEANTTVYTGTYRRVERWKSPIHKKIMELYDNRCAADMSVNERANVKNEIESWIRQLPEEDREMLKA